MIKHFVVALVAIILASYLLLENAVSQRQAMHQQHAQLIKSLANSGLGLDISALIKLLDQEFDYHQLDVDAIDGTAIHHFVSGQPLSWQDDALALFPGATTPGQVTLDNYNLNFSFQLNTQVAPRALNLIFNTTLLILALVFISAALHAWYKRQRDKKLVDLLVTSVNEEASPSISQHFGPLFGELDHALQANNKHIDDYIRDAQQAASNLNQPAYCDNITGLPNRHRFIRTIDDLLNNRDGTQSHGVLVMARSSQLHKISQEQGHIAGEQYILDMRDLLQTSLSAVEDASLYRLNGCDFAVILPLATLNIAQQYAHQLQQALDNYQSKHNRPACMHLGLVYFDSGRPLGELLASADSAINLAQGQTSPNWYLHHEIDEDQQSPLGRISWRKTIAEIIDKRRLHIIIQPIVPTNRNNRCYAEVLARFKTADEQILPTATLFNMAEKLDRHVEIDKLVVDLAMQHINDHFANDQFFGINLCAASVRQPEFLIWLERRLLRQHNVTNQLVFEVNEYGLQQDLANSKKFIDMIHRCGAKVTVEKFGVGMTSFKFFRDLRPDFIKMDGSYSRGIDEDRNNQYFLRLMVDLAHRLGVKVLAENVETEQEKHMLEQLLIDGAQGYLVGKPRPLNP